MTLRSEIFPPGAPPSGGFGRVHHPRRYQGRHPLVVLERATGPRPRSTPPSARSIRGLLGPDHGRCRFGAAAGPALAQSAVRCPTDSCSVTPPPVPKPPPPPVSQTIGEDFTAITAFTNTGLSCTFGFPVVNTTFATRVSTWAASVQCSAPVPSIAGKTVFDLWDFAGDGIACSNGICGGFLPTFAGTSSETFTGSATLTPGVNYGVQAELVVQAPPGQFWVSGQVPEVGTPFMDCSGDSPSVGDTDDTGYFCWLDTGPFSVPSS
jgi:hypothetical protein